MLILKDERKTYSVEFKEYVSKMVVLDGHKIINVANELKIPYGTLRRWVSAYKKRQQDAEKKAQNQLLTATEYKELYEKERKKNLEFQEENEILKKAMHIFTQKRE